MDDLILKQRQLIFDLQEECLQGKRLEDSLRDAIAGLDTLLRLRGVESMQRKLQEPMQEREPSLPVNQPVTFSLDK